jgi:hypothetical protein
MSIHSGLEFVVIAAIFAIAGGVGKLIQMMYKMEQEITGTAATLKDHGRRLDSLEGEVRNILQLILRDHPR